MAARSGLRPGSGDIYRSLGGLNIRDDLTSDLLPRITFSPTVGIAAGRMDKLGIDIRSFHEPLKRAVQRVVAPSIVRNFDEGGRPAWEPLSSATLELRSRFGIASTGILVRTGLLRRTMGQLNIWTITKESAIIANLPDKVWYGAIHQGGYSSSSMAARVKKFGSARKAFESLQDDLVTAIRTGKQVGGRGINIPQRQFVMLQGEDVDDILQVFSDWIQERIDAAWPAGGVL